MSAICSIDDCPREVQATGLCHAHYEHRRRTGHDRGPFPETFADRFWEKVSDRSDPNGCWVWKAATDGTRRYGSIYRNGRLLRAHRVSYEFEHGPVPDGMVLDHLCRTTLCVNPAHLELVTQRENILRGIGFAAVNAAKTHCPHGHEYSFRTVQTTGRVYRFCRPCERERNARRAAA